MCWRVIGSIGILLVSLGLPGRVEAQPTPGTGGPPEIAQKLVREGDFALKLGLALGIGAPTDEVEAENLLAEVGIMPKNGWLADYPVTPDIVAELASAVQSAAASDKIQLPVEVALQKFKTVLLQSGLPIEPQPTGNTQPAQQLEPQEGSSYSLDPTVIQDYPSPTVINNYYQSAGPPTVTYYAPPPEYYSLYGWVPSPFWSAGFWFPGFFILHDFHQALFFGNHRFFVSNHFRDFRHNRVLRVDPVSRFRGQVFSDTRLSHSRGFIGSGRDRAFINSPRQRSNTLTSFQPAGSSRVVTTPRNSNFTNSPQLRSGSTLSGALRVNQTLSAPARSNTVVSTPFRGNTLNSSTFRSGRFASTSRSVSSGAPMSSGSSFSMPSRSNGFASTPRGLSTVSAPSSSGRSFSTPSNSGRSFGMSSRSGGGNSGAGGRRGR